MNAGTLVRAFVGREPLTWCFHVLTLAIGAAIVLSLMLFERAVSDRLGRDLAGVNLVIGAKGSPSQLVLSALLQVDAPTGNIPLEQATRFAAHPLVKMAVPVSLGDSVHGARIVGTTPAYAELFSASLADGQWWRRPMEAVLGASVAARLGARIGSEFRGQHGLSGGEEHATPYVVTGILGRTGSTIDELALTGLESVWAVHTHEEDSTPTESAVEGHEAQPVSAGHTQEVTALLVRYRSAMAAVLLPRLVNATPDLQPAVPALEVARLVKLLGVSSSVLSWLGVVLLALSAAGFVVALFTALARRRRELALLRAVGASRGLLVTLIALEGVALGAIGGLLGICMSRTLLVIAAHAGRDTPFATLTVPAPGGREVAAIAIAVGLALLASLPAAWRAGRLDPALELSRG